MPPEVVSLADRRQEKQPHISGRAHCIQCGHRWIGVAPVGMAWLDCDQCGTTKGVFDQHTEPADKALWTCNCGCQLFIVTREALHCALCGTTADFGDQ